MTKLNESGRHDKRHIQKLQLELLQAKQMLEKQRNDKKVSNYPPAKVATQLALNSVLAFCGLLMLLLVVHPLVKPAVAKTSAHSNIDHA